MFKKQNKTGHDGAYLKSQSQGVGERGSLEPTGQLHLAEPMSPKFMERVSQKMRMKTIFKI